MHVLYNLFTMACGYDNNCISYIQVGVQLIERFAFYERAKMAFAVVATGYASYVCVCVCVWSYTFTVHVHAHVHVA